MRGGNWYNGENGHARVANRNPSYFRGPQDPNHPYYHVGFRVALDLRGEIR
jgi:formylglycine-generating enzyme required for sulfatase activity